MVFLSCLRLLHLTAKQNIKKRINSGIQKQLKIFTEKDIEDDPECNFESDFMQSHKSHKDFERESEKLREKTRQWIIKNKYFKQKQPNFLTFAEKEQIKLLYSRDPDEWTVEKLAESFPATSEIISKILKSNWKPKSRNRIEAHDMTVLENWETFQKNGFPELESSLRSHLKKFAVRTLDDLEKTRKIYANWKKEELPRPISSAFLSIIDFKNNEQKPLIEANRDKQQKNSITRKIKEDETYLSDEILDTRNMRLQDFKKEKFPENKLYLADYNKFNSDIREVSTFVDENNLQMQSTEIVVTENDRKKYEIECIKDQIYIPKKLRQKGATYKIEDCYYDDDGEFLYRVPGMKK